MNIIMSGIDWTTAGVDTRQRLAFSADQVYELTKKISSTKGIGGCVLIATCNRTELYMTVEEEETLDPGTVLCAAAQLPYQDFAAAFQTRRDRQAAIHLMEVACGLRSQIIGEDQIVTQVKKALELAHASGAADNILQTLFREAATAGKEAKAKARLTAAPLSVARRSIELINEAAGELRDLKAVVIGNGEMGRLASSLLVEQGCRVTVTLRSYRHGETIVPRGCGTIPYDRRMEAIDGCDILISATTSPHFTVSRQQLLNASRKPRYIVDLAIPRDIDPGVKELSGVMFFDMDAMGDAKGDGHNQRELSQIQEMIDSRLDSFYRWWNFKNALPFMEEIKELAIRRAIGSREFSVLCGQEELYPDLERLAEQMVKRTVEVLLGGLRDVVTPEALEKCRDKMSGRLPQKQPDPLRGGPSQGRDMPLKFPLFINLQGKRALVIGAGSIAVRRVRVLKSFGARVTVIAPHILERLENVEYLQREYRSGDCAGAELVVTATDRREVNSLVAQECGALKIPVSVADSAAECTFYFPAVCRSENLVAGLVSDGTDHRLTARVAKEIRQVLNCQEGKTE